ncbi:MAG: hypothetical protein LBH47_00590 [Christensenellaceae bacterium]|jgi:hypothetical protein|nr:hypothetical protein [Christensenellaceae bacterium]
MHNYVAAFIESYDCPFEYFGTELLVKILVTALKSSVDISLNYTNVIRKVCDANIITRGCLQLDLKKLTTKWSEREKFKALFPNDIPTSQVLVTRFYHLLVHEFARKKSILLGSIAIPKISK